MYVEFCLKFNQLEIEFKKHEIEIKEVEMEKQEKRKHTKRREEVGKNDCEGVSNNWLKSFNTRKFSCYFFYAIVYEMNGEISPHRYRKKMKAHQGIKAQFSENNKNGKKINK